MIFAGYERSVNKLIGFILFACCPSQMPWVYAASLAVPTIMRRLMLGAWSGAICQFAHDTVSKFAVYVGLPRRAIFSEWPYQAIIAPEV